jgi:hypothetical protein
MLLLGIIPMAKQKRYEDHSPDVNPFDYGGLFYDTKTGHAIWFDEPNEKNVYKVHRIPDAKTDFTPEYIKNDSWIDWDSLVSSCDCADETVPMRLLQNCIWHHGAYQFDYYPDTMTKTQLKKMLNYY